MIEIRDILIHMLFLINNNAHNVLHMKNCIHAKPREAF